MLKKYNIIRLKSPFNGLIGGLIDIKRLNLLPESLIETVKCGYFVGDEEASTFEKYVKEKALSRRTIKLPFEDMIAESLGMKTFLLSAGKI